MMNVNLNIIERETKSSITAIKSDHSPDNDDILDTIDTELQKEKMNTLVLAVGPSEISKLDTGPNSNLELLREKTIDIAKKIFSVAEAAIESNDELKKAVVVKCTPRFDHPSSDPNCLKPQLCLLADSVLFGLWCESKHRNRIHLGNHDINEWSKHDITKAYGHPYVQGYDGIHLSGKAGKYILTRSILCILKQAEVIPGTKTENCFPSLTSYNPMLMLRERIRSTRSVAHPPSPSPLRSSPPSQVSRTSVIKDARSAFKNQYSIPVSNRYQILGN